MDRSTDLDRLTQLAQRLLDPSTDGVGLFAATNQLNELLARLAPLKRADRLREFIPDTPLEQGVAVSPACAADCGLEPLRVSRFLQGVERAIETARQRFAPGPVHLLYAGSGPYATLVTPLLSRYTPDQLQLTLLDYHEVSLVSVRALLTALGLEGFIKGCVEADASRYRHPTDDPIHVVVSETMAAALDNEMQVAITLNLAPQLAEGGLWVPETIRLGAVLAHPREILRTVDYLSPPPYPALNHDRWLGSLFEIGVEQALAFSSADHTTHLPAGELVIPDIRGTGLEIFLVTEITVNGNIVLKDRDCTLNHPRLLPAGVSGCSGTTARFAYRLGARPGLVGVGDG